MQGHSQTGQKAWLPGILTPSPVYLLDFVCLKSFLYLQINALIKGTSPKETSSRRKVKKWLFYQRSTCINAHKINKGQCEGCLITCVRKLGPLPEQALICIIIPKVSGWVVPACSVSCIFSNLFPEGCPQVDQDNTQVSLKDHSKSRTEINTLSMICASAFARVLNEFCN